MAGVELLNRSGLLRRRVRQVQISHLEIDEIWTFVRKKQRRVSFDEDARKIGDAWCYIALDRASRLVVAWHLDQRDEPNTADFIIKKPLTETGISTPLAEVAGDRSRFGRRVRVSQGNARARKVPSP